MKADGLISALGHLNPQYRNRRPTIWLAHRDFKTQIRKLKDGDGNYLWRAGLDGNPNTSLGFPLILSEYAQHSFTSGQYVAVLGDFSYYWIVDALNMQIQRLTELYAESTHAVCGLSAGRALHPVSTRNGKCSAKSFRRLGSAGDSTVDRGRQLFRKLIFENLMGRGA